MGRKKKRHNKALIFCYYCDRQFESERVLIQHQRAKHFKCPQCHKRISSAHGMMLHVFQVHKETIDSVPAAKEGRDSFDIEIFGMDGVPSEIIAEKRMKVYGEVASKRPRLNGHPMAGSIGAATVLLPGAPSSMATMSQMAPPPQMMPIPMGGFIPGMRFMAPPGAMMAPPGAMMAMPRPPMGFAPPPMAFGGPPPGAPPFGGPPPGAPPNGMPPQIAAPPPHMMAPNQQPPPPHLYTAPRTTAGQPFGGYGQPMPATAPPMQMMNPGLMAAASQPLAQSQPLGVPTSRKKNIFRVYDDELMSMEEKRAMHPKYSGHLRKRINSLEDSIAARIQMLANGKGQAEGKTER